MKFRPPFQPSSSGNSAQRRSGYAAAATFRSALVAIFSIAIAFSTGSSALGQETPDSLPGGVVPPPLNLISDQERNDLDAERKMKGRTKLALEFMDSRIKLSELAASNEKYQESLDELGRFQALVRDTFRFLKENEGEKGSLKNLKKFEMTLKDFIPRLEMIRRALPYKYGYHVREMINFVVDARAEALEPFFGDTVISEGGSLR